MEEKILKRWLKRKVKITEALLIGFLITGGISYGLDLGAVNDENISVEFTFTTDPTEAQEAEMATAWPVLPSDVKDFTNNGNIKASYSETNIAYEFQDQRFYKGNGVDLKDTSQNIINNGILQGNIILEGKKVDEDNLQYATPYPFGDGNGISSYSTNPTSIGNVSNSGQIVGSTLVTGGTAANSGSTSGSAHASGSGNGVGSHSRSFGHSSIGDVTNFGQIMGNVILTAGTATTTGSDYTAAYDCAYGSGNGVSAYSFRSTSIGNVTNSGQIVGNAIIIGGTATTTGSASTTANDCAYGSGNGVSSYSDRGSSGFGSYGSIGTITNSGTISGYASATPGIFKKENTSKVDWATLYFSGNGIAVDGKITNPITNFGVIKGSQSAIAATGMAEGVTATNYGLMAGREIYSDGIDIVANANQSNEINKILTKLDLGNKEINLGTYVKLVSLHTTENPYVGTADNIGSYQGDLVGMMADGKTPKISSITVGTGGDTGTITRPDGTSGTMFIINGTVDDDSAFSGKDSSLTVSDLNSKTENLILNGAGMEKGAFVVDSELSLTNSIINGYNTALYVEGENSFTGTDVILNGGGLKGDVAVVRGDEVANTITFDGKSIVNGDIDMGAGDDELNVTHAVMVNGDMIGGDGTADTLILGTDNKNFRYFNQIREFEHIATHGNMTFYKDTVDNSLKTLKISQGTLGMDIDPTIKDGEKYTGHFLYNKTEDVKVTSDGTGVLQVNLNGLGEGTLIATGSKVDLTGMDKNWWEGGDYLRTSSAMLDASLVQSGTVGSDIIIKRKDWSSITTEIKPTPSDPAPNSVPDLPSEPPVTEVPDGAPANHLPAVNEDIITDTDAVITTDDFKFTNYGQVVQTDGTSGNAITLPETTSPDGTVQKVSGVEIDNSGKIQGEYMATTSETTTRDRGNGIVGDLGRLVNRGRIEGKVSLTPTGSISNLFNSGNALDGSVNEMTNYGLMGGTASISIGDPSPENIRVYLSGNGVNRNLSDLKNLGTLSGNVSVQAENRIATTIDIELSGSGLAWNGDMNGRVMNSGLMKGSQSAIAVKSLGTNASITNYGVMAGKYIISSDREVTGGSEADDISLQDLTGDAITANKFKNLGTLMTNKDDNIQITIGTAGIGTTASILNPNGETKVMGILNGYQGNIFNGDDGNTVGTVLTGITDTWLSASNVQGRNSGVIINGTGLATGALVLDADLTLENSIVNGYQTALYMEDGKTFTGTDVIFNGDTDKAVIQGDGGVNTLYLEGNSIVNGNIDLGAGDDALYLETTAIVNGDKIDGGEDKDTLKIGKEGVTAERKLDFARVQNFEYIATRGTLTLASNVSSRAKGLEKITIENGTLILDMDSTQQDGNSKYTGHGLYGTNSADTNILIARENGNLQFNLNGIGSGSTISMDGLTLDDTIKNENLATDSAILTAKFTDGDNVNKDVIIQRVEFPPVNPDDSTSDTDSDVISEPVPYQELGDIYESIGDAGRDGLLATLVPNEDTHDKVVANLYDLMDQFYGNNPYGYGLKMSRESLRRFEDELSYFTIKPHRDEWIVQGKGIYSHISDKNHGSISSYRIKEDTVGGLGTGEYGITEATSLGFVVGGLHQNAEFRRSNKLKGDSLYVGGFAKNDYKNFRFRAGAGYLYTSAKGERNLSNRYGSYGDSDRFDINSMDIYGEMRYMPKPVNGWSVEPRMKLALYYTSQDRVDEGYDPSTISMGTDKAHMTTGALEVAADIRKDFTISSGKLSAKVTLGVVNLLGNNQKDMTGYILGDGIDGRDFTFKGTKLQRTTGKTGFTVEYQHEKGYIGTVELGYEFGGDYKNFETSVGIGYRF